MPHIFTAKPGTVAVSQIDAVVAGAIIGLSPNIPGQDDGGAGCSARSVLITGFGYSQDVNLQFLPALSQVIYVYSFGDRVGSVQVTGLALQNPNASQLGVDSVLEYYKENRAIESSQRIKITIGKNQLTGILRGVNLSGYNQEIKTTGFSLDIAVIQST